MAPLRKPEVMSPAGYWPQLRAAIEAGADAVYFGLKHFTARAKVGFSLAELPEVMATLHRRGVKGYITFNTLVFDHELDEAARALAAIAEAGADAIIVQDVGMVQLAKRIAPDLEIHGSTQMSVTSADGVRLAQSFGVSRVTLARELVARRGARHPRRDRLRAGNFRPRRAVRGVLRAVLFLGSLGRPQRQSRPVRAGLPAALRADCGWHGAPAGRCALPAVAGRSLRAAAGAGDRGDRHLRAEDRRPLQGRRLRGADHARLPPGGGRGLGGPETHAGSRPPSCGWSRSIRAAWARISSTARITRRWCDGRAPRHRGVLMGACARGDRGGRLDRAFRGARHCAAQAGRRRGVRCGRLAQSGGARRRRAHLRDRSGAANWRFGNGVDPWRAHPAAAIWSGARTIPISIKPLAVYTRPPRRCASSR